MLNPELMVSAPRPVVEIDTFGVFVESGQFADAFMSMNFNAGSDDNIDDGECSTFNLDPSFH